MPEIPKLGLKQLRDIITDAGELAKGARIADEGGLSHLSRYEHKLFADAQGSSVYKVQIIFEDKGPRGRCSCMAARSRPFCKHAAALLVAWSNAPDSFAVSDSAPAGAGDGKKKAVKKGKVDAGELMAKGIEQVGTLVRELAVAGVAAMADDRADQVRALGENLREHKLRRLSGKTVALADMLERARKAGDAFDESAYTELLADLLLTARKLEKHLAGEALEDRHVEELIGKTWTKKDRAPIANLDLVEVAFLSRETADDFVIRESRFIELASGEHYSEKQILPRFLAKRTPPKPSYAGNVLGGAGGSLYPSYAPKRLDLEAPSRTVLDAAAVQRVIERALPGVKAAIAALQEHKKDVFAPEYLPVTIACDMVIADRGRLQLADSDGSAVFLPDDDRVADRVASALTGATLRAVVGDLTLDGALPTIVPLAVVIDGRRGLELRSVLVVDPARGSRKIRAADQEAAGRSNWALTARAMGLSTAAIALGEVREELAGLLFAGLTSVTARRVEPLATRLRELSLAKQADVLAAIAARPEPAERLDDLIKLHQVLGIALSRLAGAATIDKSALETSVMFQSVFVRKSDEVLEPAAIATRVARGQMNRFEAATRYARHYESLPADELVGKVFPTWADGSASPFVAHAARRYPERALEEAAALIASGSGIGEARKGRYGRTLAPPRMATLTALRVLEALGEPGKPALRMAAERHTDHTVRGLARIAMGRLAGAQSLDVKQAGELRGALLNAPTLEERARAAGRLADMGDVDAIPLLRISYAGDVSSDVRDAAGRALGRLGDADSVDTFIQALRNRDDDAASAVTAAMALGYVGDVRGIEALLSAYSSGWRPEIVADALTAIGPAAIPILIRYVAERPDLIKRSTARTVFETLPAEPLRDAVIERLDELASYPDLSFVSHAATLLELTKARSEVFDPVGRHIVNARPQLGAKGASREARALFKKAGGKPQ